MLPSIRANEIKIEANIRGNFETLSFLIQLNGLTNLQRTLCKSNLVNNKE